MGREFNIYKSDDDKRLVFGWASVSIRTDGTQIIDHQGDILDPEDLEETVYDYVLKFRDAGEEHISFLRKKGKLVESCVFTKEKMEAMGIPPGIVPEGWWIGFKVYDDETWRKIKSGEYRMFSIEGQGIREEVSESKIGKSLSFKQMLHKFNPYHGKDGRFTGPGGAASFTYKPGQGRMYDLAIEREKQRTGSMGGSGGNTKTSRANGKAKQNFADAYGQEHADNIEKLVSNAPEIIQDVWNKYAGNISIARGYKGGGKFIPSTGKICVNIEKDASESQYSAKYSTVMHESGHAIDHMFSKQLSDGSGEKIRFSKDYNDGIFEKTIIQEANDYIKMRQQQRKEAGRPLTGIQAARMDVGDELRAKGSLAAEDVSDMFEGATKGKFSGPSGHGKEYWTGKKMKLFYDSDPIVIGAHSVATETFAEMFDATVTNPESLKEIKHYFPKSYEVFKEMLGEMK